MWIVGSRRRNVTRSLPQSSLFLSSCFGNACTWVHAGKKGGSTVCGSMTAVSPSSSSLNRKFVKAIFDLSAFS